MHHRPARVLTAENFLRRFLAPSSTPVASQPGAGASGLQAILSAIFEISQPCKLRKFLTLEDVRRRLPFIIGRLKIAHRDNAGKTARGLGIRTRHGGRLGRRLSGRLRRPRGSGRLIRRPRRRLRGRRLSSKKTWAKRSDAEEDAEDDREED